MKIGDLIMLLSRYPVDAEVFISYASNDYWASQVAAPVRRIQNENITPSNVFGHVIVSHERREAMDEDERASVRDVVVLR